MKVKEKENVKSTIFYCYLKYITVKEIINEKVKDKLKLLLDNY